MKFRSTVRLLAGAALISGLAACGNTDKPAASTADTTAGTTVDTTVVQPAPAAMPVAEAAAIAPAASATVTLAALTGDAVKGEKVFGQCKTCHVAEQGVNRIGPSLWGVIGRPAGIVAGYSYSSANKNSGLIWTAEQVFTYLEAPQKTVPGTKMAFAGLKNPQDRADVIAYLKTRA